MTVKFLFFSALALGIVGYIHALVFEHLMEKGQNERASMYFIKGTIAFIASFLFLLSWFIAALFSLF